MGKALTVTMTVFSFVMLALTGCSHGDTELTEPGVTTRALPAVDDVREVEPWGPAGIDHRSITAGGLKRDYIVSMPAGARQRDRLPVIFVFHGYKEDAEKIRKNSGLDAADAIVAYLDGKDSAWAPAPYASTSGQQDLAFVDAVLAELEGEFSIDRSRVFAAGFSNGGGFAAFVGCQRPQAFTGIATVAGAYYQRVSAGCSQIPMMHVDFHGTADKVIAYNGGQRHATAYNSVEEMLNESASRNHCAERDEDTEVVPGVLRERWSRCDAELAHYRIDNGPHVWPGGAADSSGTVPKGFATDAMLKFFRLGRATQQ